MTPFFKTKASATAALTSLVLAACGGGGEGASSAPPEATATLSGVVADGYLGGATVCIDINANGTCDAGEHSAVSAASGAYAITLPASQSTAFPLVAQVPASAVDADAPSRTVGQAYTLTAPIGATFISPLTTLVQQKIQAGQAPAAANAAVVAALKLTVPSGVSVSALDNYVLKKGTASVQTDPYARLHAAAKTVVAALQMGKKTLESDSAWTDQAVQTALVAQAFSVLLSQGGTLAAPTDFAWTDVQPGQLAGASTLKATVAAARLNPARSTQPVTLNFDVVNGAQAVGITGCNSPSLTLGTLATAGKMKDLRFYVSGVSLIDAAGQYTPLLMTENANQGRNVALLDFEDATGNCSPANGTPATYTAITGRVAPGQYVGVAFTLGVPVLSADGGPVTPLNHSNYAAATTPQPLLSPAMSWAWQSGRKFTKIEFTSNAVVPPATAGVTTMVHLGSTGCVGNPVSGEITHCASPNRVNVQFASGFNAASNKIALDLGALFAGVDLSSNKTWMSSKTQNEPVAPGAASGVSKYYFDKFQLQLKSGLPVNDGAAQNLFVIR